MILLVDDDEDTRMLLDESLRRRGFDVQPVASAQECLEWVRDRDVDVVVTDFQMPGMSGIELCEQLRERHPDCSRSCSPASAHLDIAIAAIRAGAYDFVTKPVKIDVLEVALDRALEHFAVQREVQPPASRASTRERRSQALIGDERGDARDAPR